ncbi:response regulator [Halarcobacter anaerophilus]|jgi:CheY-like chemotaxis protein|uniref:Response regulator n=1 Tax=Halarcobacter anaerophilus TaxID=877500 RepID=A0A4Q0Y1X2_9BACT|nr:response regulator [Halarcobacter anaerophilus]QDF27747.1 response regulator receiver domain-containing protein [Halarcobacter anaerophilus]RXJ64090.1 response regulator [Halarcobacter anaerophilus]
MNILIIESEIYLAQKVVSRLLDDGHNCDFVESPNIDNLTKDYDIILLSTSLPAPLCKTIIRRYNDSIILLLVSYISDETVTDPIKEGAKDYIMKPFIMDELLRKIYHYRECRSLRKELETLREYLNFQFANVDTSGSVLPTSFPILIETNSQISADKLAFELCRKLDYQMKFISLNSENWQKLVNERFNGILYLTDYHTLKKSAKENLNRMIEEKKVILVSLEAEDDFPYSKVNFHKDDELMFTNSIMTINDYVKMMVLSYQSKYPDTELSKKLGISRKSLWEKRKKLGIEKKK